MYLLKHHYHRNFKKFDLLEIKFVSDWESINKHYVAYRIATFYLEAYFGEISL